jgi:hypothetical protein
MSYQVLRAGQEVIHIFLRNYNVHIEIEVYEHIKYIFYSIEFFFSNLSNLVTIYFIALLEEYISVCQ